MLFQLPNRKGGPRIANGGRIKSGQRAGQESGGRDGKGVCRGGATE